MHRTKILRALIFTAVGFGAASYAAAKVDVFKEFNAKIAGLEKTLAKEKSVFKRYDAFLKTHREINVLRNENPRQAEANELNMSFFMDALISLPAKKDFQEKKCPDYVKEVELAGRSNEDKDNEYSEKAIKITKLICKK